MTLSLITDMPNLIPFHRKFRKMCYNILDFKYTKNYLAPTEHVSYLSGNIKYLTLQVICMGSKIECTVNSLNDPYAAAAKLQDF